MKTETTLLLNVLKDPRELVGLNLQDWNYLLRLAHACRVLSRISVMAAELNLLSDIPGPVRPHLDSGRLLADRHDRVIRWEVNRLERVLEDIDTPRVLLKGAAYVMANSVVAKGRLFSDIDLLVRKSHIAEVEKRLLAGGWETAPIDPRDQQYFRTWMHELPPMKHRRRRTVLDVHHTILPLTDRLQVEPDLLLEASSEIPESKMRVLAPTDRILHSAAHLFRNGDFSHGVRDLLDLDGLFRESMIEADFETRLLDRAEQLDLRLPCYCGLRYAHRYFETPVSATAWEQMQAWCPPALGLRLLDRLVDRALVPNTLEEVDTSRDRAIALLAHWPVPRLRTMMTSLFWTKRLPWRTDQATK